MAQAETLEDSPPPWATTRRSRFTHRQLAQMAAFNPTCPLRVVAHIDLDAFYAQCEMVRLGVPEDKPLAVQQWQGLIAINYAARKWDINRHCNVVEAKKLCPDLITQHVATWREGDDKWAYRDDAPANMAIDKVSLDPYRLQSRKILALVKDCLPRDLQRVEKASIDEVFLDLSAQVHAEMLRRFPVLSGPPPYADASEALPLPPAIALDWKSDDLVRMDGGDDGAEPEGEGEGEGEEKGKREGEGQVQRKNAKDKEERDLDWDDITIWIGSGVVRDIRAQIREKLGYTCSAGIANNKLLSKLGSAFKKPNRQTVVRARAVPIFLAGVKLSKMRNLGGKLGEQVVSALETDDIGELLDVPLERMMAKLGQETGLWVHNTIRGIDHSPVNSRTQIKSMLSAKSFRPPIGTCGQAVRWLRIFCADIYSRLVEEGMLEHKRRPRTINLHHRHGGQTKSRQAPIPPGRALDEQVLFSLANELLAQIVSEGSVWPCANLSLSVGSFEDGVRGNMGIGAFLVKGPEAASPRSASPESQATGTTGAKRKAGSDDAGIQRFFTRKPPGDVTRPSDSGGSDATSDHHMDARERDHETSTASAGEAWAAFFACPRCEARFDFQESLESHGDWHLAMDLQEEERGKSTRPCSRSHGNRQAAPLKRGSGLEPGQSRLRFG